MSEQQGKGDEFYCVTCGKSHGPLVYIGSTEIFPIAILPDDSISVFERLQKMPIRTKTVEDFGFDD